MSAKTIDHNTLSKLIKAGAIHGAQVIGQVDGWSILVKIDTEVLSKLAMVRIISTTHVIEQIKGWGGPTADEILVRPLAASRSKKIRTFKKLETLAAYLKEIGINRFDVDTTQYDPANVQTYSRPDRAEAMKFAHEAASHDKWFREQVELTLKEADDPNTVWIPHDIAKTNMQQQRNLLARIGKTE